MIPKLHGEYLRTRRRRRESLHSVHPDSLVDIHELSPDEVVIHSFIPKCEVTVTQSRPWNRCLPQTARGWVQDGAVDNSVDRLQALALLTELQREFAVTIADVDLDAPVPWCGEWRGADLVEHLAGVHHWAAAQARSQDEGPLPPAADLTEHYRWCAAELAETLAVLDPDQPARTLVPDGRVGFWYRRQLHETLVHLWDIRTAGRLSLAVDARIWADTVEEVVTVMHPRQVRLGRARPPSARIALVADDVGREWTMLAAPEASLAPAVSVTGSAEALALLLWCRTDLDDRRLTVTGDRQLLAAVLSGRVVP